MKTILIPDVHGRTYWSKIIEQEKTFDKVVFLGDFFDSREINIHLQMRNFMDILDFKRKNKDKVVFLCGNHEFHYLPFCLGMYSGWNEKLHNMNSIILKELFDNKELICNFVTDKYLITHAGVSKTFLSQYNIEVEDLNELFYSKPKAFNFQRGSNFSNYGDDICQTPIWIRPKSLRQDAVEGYVQIVGHTACEKIELIDNVIQIDTFSNDVIEYVTIIDGELVINTLEHGSIRNN